jgi:hypothetical protein
MSKYYDMCIRNPRKTAAYINELEAAAQEVVTDNHFLCERKPNETDSYGINARKLWRLKKVLPRQ